jgi:hypothetical protein
LTETTQQPVRYRYVVRQQLKVGSEYRQPGQEINEAADWPPQVLRAYLSAGQIEEIVVTDGSGVERKPQGAPTFAPADYDRRVPVPGPVVGDRHPAEGYTVVDCTNCRDGQSMDSINHVPPGHTTFQCWHCGQQQTVAEALRYPPQSYDEWKRTGFRQGGR